MKVNIGPYPRNLSIPLDSWWLKWRYPDVVFYDRTPITRLDHLIDKIDSFINLKLLIPFESRFIRPFNNRRIKVKVDSYDVWSLDHTLSLIILPALKELKRVNNGSPHVDDGDVPEELHRPEGFVDSEAHKNGELDDNWFLRWEWILDEMIWTFTQLTEDNWDLQYHHGNIDFVFEKCESPEHEGLSELVKGPNDTHWFDKEGYDKHQERINNGLKLFGKYYQSLWS